MDFKISGQLGLSTELSIQHEINEEMPGNMLKKGLFPPPIILNFSQKSVHNYGLSSSLARLAMKLSFTLDSLKSLNIERDRFFHAV